MLLGGGTLDGVRILRKETVDAAFTNQIGDLDFPAEIAHRRPGVDAPTSTPARATSGATGLLLNTQDIPGIAARVQRRLGGPAQHPLLGGPRQPGSPARSTRSSCPFVTPEACGMYQDFERALYASL